MCPRAPEPKRTNECEGTMSAAGWEDGGMGGGFPNGSILLLIPKKGAKVTDNIKTTCWCKVRLRVHGPVRVTRGGSSCFRCSFISPFSRESTSFTSDLCDRPDESDPVFKCLHSEKKKLHLSLLHEAPTPKSSLPLVVIVKTRAATTYFSPHQHLVPESCGSNLPLGSRRC